MRTPDPVTLACLALTVAAAAHAERPTELELGSCVSGSPPLRVPLATERAALDAGDRATFQDAALARYPLYQRGGWMPEQVLLFRRDGHWQYAVLTATGTAGPCLSAVFAADRFAFTSRWLAKYRPRAVEAAD